MTLPVSAYMTRRAKAVAMAQRVANAMREDRVVYENLQAYEDAQFGCCSPEMFAAAQAARNENGTAPLVLVEYLEPEPLSVLDHPVQPGIVI